MSKIFFYKKSVFFKTAVFSFENQIFAQFFFQNLFQTNAVRTPERDSERTFVWN